MEIRYEHQNNCNYLVIEDDKEYKDYQFKMLMYNKPDHFLKISSYAVNGKHGYYYNVTSKQQISKFFEYGKMSIEDVKTICVNISEMVKLADDYMLDLDHISLEPRYIYMDVGTRKLHFIYHSSFCKCFQEGLKELFEFILEHFDHSLDKESVVKLYEVYQKVLVEDYDAYNLIRMFGPVKQKEIEEEDVEKDIVVNEVVLPMKENKKENKKTIKTVMPEQITNDSEKVNDRKKYINMGYIISACMLSVGLLNIFAEDLLPYKIGFMTAVCLIGVGIIVLALMQRLGSSKMIMEPIQVYEKQGVSYVSESIVFESVVFESLISGLES